MTTFIGEGLGTYANAMDCIQELRHNGISANITTGGISIWAEDKDVETEGVTINQVKLMHIVVQSFGGKAYEGNRTTLSERIIDGMEKRKTV
jgi:hypothetical protein